MRKTLKIRRAEFHEFVKPVGLVAWRFKSVDSALGEQGGQETVMLSPLKRQQFVLRGIQKMTVYTMSGANERQICSY